MLRAAAACLEALAGGFACLRTFKLSVLSSVLPLPGVCHVSCGAHSCVHLGHSPTLVLSHNTQHARTQVALTAILWGCGTAVGEVPPYFLSYQAAAAGRRSEVHTQLEVLQQSAARGTGTGAGAAAGAYA
jgi:hypothetical protein